MPEGRAPATPGGTLDDVLSLRDTAGLTAEETASLKTQLGAFAMLEDLVRWGYSSSPPHDVVEVVVQDEFCHDVVLSWEGGRYLVFDTT